MKTWEDGVKDAIKIVKDRKAFLESLAPRVTPSVGVIAVLDALLVQLEAMQLRGQYSSYATLDGGDR